MLNRMSLKITSRLVSKYNLTVQDSEWLAYLVEYVLGASVTYSLILFVGALIHGTFSGAFYALTFVSVCLSVRSFAGGFHAKNQDHCMVLSILSYMLVYLVSMPLSSVKLENSLYAGICGTLTLIGALMVAICAPVETKNAPLSNLEIHWHRWLAIAAVSLITVLDLILICNNVCHIALTISCLSVFYVGITVLLGKLQNQKANRH